MKILQLNAWGGRLVKQINNLFEKESPDIICLQEAISLPRGKNAGFFITVEALAEKFDMHLYYSPTVGFKFMNRTAEFGNAILSKFPLSNQRTIFTHKEYIPDFDAITNDYNARNLSHVTININAKIFNILTHHGYRIPLHKNGDEETLRQCKFIADYVANLKGEIILTGDFNLTPHSTSLEQLNTMMNNACLDYNIVNTRTKLNERIEVCDYIFTSDNVKVKSFRLATEVVSDHKALIMEMELEERDNEQTKLI